MTILKYSDDNATTQGAADSTPFPVRESAGIPHSGATPSVAAASKAYQEFGDGTVETIGIRYTVNAPDDVTAAQRLLNGYPDVGFLGHDGQAIIQTDADITRVDLVAVGTDTAGTPAAGTPIGVVGGIGTDATEAQTQTSAIQFDFNSNDKVRLVALTSTVPYTASAAPASAGTYIGVLVEGRTYA